MDEILKALEILRAATPIAEAIIRGGRAAYDDIVAVLGKHGVEITDAQLLAIIEDDERRAEHSRREQE